MVKIIRDFIVPKGTVRPYKKRKIEYIVIHDTGNTSKGAGAECHNRYIHNLAKENKTSKSWHYTVDDREIFQHIPDDEVAWACGDGNGPGNTGGIQIEICVNSDSDTMTARYNASVLVAQLLVKYGLTLKHLKRHKDFTNKNCPASMSENVWEDFKNDVEIEYNRLVENSSKHWVDDDVEYLEHLGIKLAQKRYNDPMTRAEVISLIARSIRVLRGE